MIQIIQIIQIIVFPGFYIPTRADRADLHLNFIQVRLVGFATSGIVPPLYRHRAATVHTSSRHCPDSIPPLSRQHPAPVQVMSRHCPGNVPSLSTHRPANVRASPRHCPGVRCLIPVCRNYRIVRSLVDIISIISIVSIISIICIIIKPTSIQISFKTDLCVLPRRNTERQMIQMIQIIQLIQIIVFPGFYIPARTNLDDIHSDFI